MFRVRSKQPNECHDKKISQVAGTSSATEQPIPIVTDYVMIGDVCAFMHKDTELRIGRVLQFCIYENTNKLGYKGNYSFINKKNWSSVYIIQHE